MPTEIEPTHPKIADEWGTRRPVPAADVRAGFVKDGRPLRIFYPLTTIHYPLTTIHYPLTTIP